MPGRELPALPIRLRLDAADTAAAGIEMKGTDAMSEHFRTAGALALGALVVAVAALAVRPGPAVGAPVTGDQPAIHTITVSATGAVTLIPDVARVGVGVTVTKPTVKAARDAAGASMNAIIAGLKGLGIDEKDIRTTSIDLSPQYANGSSTKIVGFRMSEQLQITVRDLDKAGDVVDTATAEGATDVNGMWFEVGDPAKAMDQARADAITKARTSAQAMASAAGVTLGAVVSISEASVSYPGPYYGVAGSAARDMATPVQPGTQDVQANVTVIFQID
jgi:uncharacterized protein YggE